MKIMCVIPGMTNGGAERVMSTLVNYFSINNEVRLVVLKSSKSDYPISSKIDLRTGNIKNKSIFKSVKFIKNNLEEYKPDIVLSFITSGNIATLLANKLLKNKYKIVISERANPYRIKKLFYFLRNMTYPTANGCVFQTDWAQEFYSKMMHCKTQVIYNPLSPDFKVEKFNGKRDKRIVCTARLSPEKNQELLIYAFDIIKNKYPDYKVEIYGEGPEKEKLQKIINKLSLSEQVKLMGRRKNIIESIKSASVFVLPSNSEGMSNALLESMALGIPSISTDSPIGGSAIIIDNNKNGILIPMKDPEAMASAIQKIIDDKEFADKISSEGTRVLEKFETIKICNQWEDFLRKVTEE